METVYLNSKNEEVEMKDMKTPHLLYAIAKNAKYIGMKTEVGGTLDPEGCARKEAEIKGMHHEVMSRFAELSEAAK